MVVVGGHGRDTTRFLFRDQPFAGTVYLDTLTDVLSKEERRRMQEQQQQKRFRDVSGWLAGGEMLGRSVLDGPASHEGSMRSVRSTLESGAYTSLPHLPAPQLRLVGPG